MMSSRPESSHSLESSDPCAACGIDASRRSFLRDVTLAIAGIAATLGIPASARALAVSGARATDATGDTVKYPVPAADGVTFDKEREIILVRWQGSLHAFRLSCPHQKTALKWKESDARFQCPKHKSRYQPDGTFISGRATRGMDRFAVRRVGNDLVVDTSQVFLEDKDKAGWSGAVARV